MTEIKLARPFFSDLRYFPAQVPGFDRVSYRDAKFFKVDGLGDEIVGATAECGNRVINLDVTGDHDHDCFRMIVFDFTQYIEAGTVRKIDVE